MENTNELGHGSDSHDEDNLLGPVNIPLQKKRIYPRISNKQRNGVCSKYHSFVRLVVVVRSRVLVVTICRKMCAWTIYFLREKKYEAEKLLQ